MAPFSSAVFPTPSSQIFKLAKSTLTSISVTYVASDTTTISILTTFLAISITLATSPDIYFPTSYDYKSQVRHLQAQTYLAAISDADWLSNLDDRRLVGGYNVFLRPNLVSWSSKKQNIVSRSTAESECKALALAIYEVLWITYMLKELKVQLIKSPILH